MRSKILLFQVILVVSLFNILAGITFAEWPSDPTVNVPICTAADTQQIGPQLVSDGAGGAIITWDSKYDDIPDYDDIYAQRVDANGAVLWTTNGVPICRAAGGQVGPRLVSDGAGGAIITWQDWSSSDIYAQRVNASGAVLWITDGVPICAGRDHQLISDGAGGAIITWGDGRSGNYDIYAQRVNGSGAVLWTTNGVPICTTASDQWYPQLVSDGAGGAIITWQDKRGGKYTDDIYAQRVNGIGAVLWTTDGVPICTAINVQEKLKLVSDGAGGAIITWQDQRSYPSYYIYAQRVNSSSAVLWTTDGVPICTAASDNKYPQLVSDGAGGAIITWVDWRSGYGDIYAQRVNGSGAVLWTTDGVPICTAGKGKYYPQLISDGAGGAIITWHDYRSGHLDIYAQRVGVSGTMQWATDGVPICTAAGDQQYHQLVSAATGGAIIAWQDFRSGSWDIYAQKVKADGTLAGSVLNLSFNDLSPEIVLLGQQNVPMLALGFGYDVQQSTQIKQIKVHLTGDAQGSDISRAKLLDVEGQVVAVASFSDRTFVFDNINFDLPPCATSVLTVVLDIAASAVHNRTITLVFEDDDITLADSLVPIVPKDFHAEASVQIDPRFGETVYVNGTTGDDTTGVRGEPSLPFKTIQAGIDAAYDGDTVLVADGTYTGIGNKNLDFGGKAITVKSENGAAVTIIDCKKDGRGFCFHSGETELSVVDGFTITNGYVGSDEGGGGIECSNSSSPTIRNNTITGNSSGFGGGIACNSSYPTISNNTITGNSAANDGGGIECYQSSPTIINNTITGNLAQNGGGGVNDYSTTTTITGNSADDEGGGIDYHRASFPTIINNTTIGNSAKDVGGGIDYYKSSSFTISNNTITDNSSGFGGGIACNSSYPTISNNTITGNSVAYDGGGIECYNARYSPISNNTIVGNLAYGYGGGVVCVNVYSTISNNTIVDNSAEYGGGVVCSNSNSEIVNNTITGNSAYGGGGAIACYSGSSPAVRNTIFWADSPEEIRLKTSEITITYSDIQGGWKGEGNIDADPLFVDAANGDYHLRAGSPCLSSATPNGAPPTDKDGNPRPSGSGYDMGCYEESDGGFLYGDVSSNWKITAFDASLVLQSVIGAIQLSEAQTQAADVTGNGSVTALDAALILQYCVGLIQRFPVDQPVAAPSREGEPGNALLAEAIKQLESASLNQEQKVVLEQIKILVGYQPLPRHPALLQNYPNPFNPDTWIPYQLAEDADVTIKVYNVTGRLVRTLELGQKLSGLYFSKEKAAYWDGKNESGEKIASGIYFYTLQAGEFRATRKMVILK